MLLGDGPRGGGVTARSRPRSPSAPATASSSVRKAIRPSPAGSVAAEPGVLHEHGLARREIAHGAIAEPAAAGVDVDALRHGELGTGALDVAAEPLGIAGRLDADRSASSRSPRAARGRVSSAGSMASAISNGCDARRGSSANRRNSWTLTPKRCPSCSIGPNAPRQLATVVNRLGSAAGLTGHSSSTTGGRVRPPLDAGVGYRAVRRAHVLRDREVRVVPSRVRVRSRPGAARTG